MDSKSFLDTVVSIINRNRSVDGEDGITAARLGWLLRSLHGIDWTEFGYPKLSAVLADLAASGLARVGKNGKDALTVWPAVASPASTEARLANARPPAAHSPFRRLRTAAWNAFVLPPRSENEHRYIQRENGIVQNTLSVPPTDSQQWVEVEPIPESQQRIWALELLKDIGIETGDPLFAAIERSDWYHTFSAGLASRNRIFASQWNRVRSTRVQSHVEAWCERYGVPHEIVFEPYRFTRQSPSQTASSHASLEVERPLTLPVSTGLRRMLFESLEMMSTEELLTLPIPGRYLVPVLRPELSRR